MATCKSYLATRPLLYTDSIKGQQICRDDMWAVTTEELNQLHEDAMTMALRLLGERDDTFAPETREVMNRWGKRALEIVSG